MSINNIYSKIESQNIPSGEPVDSKVLESLVNSYFPEFNTSKEECAAKNIFNEIKIGGNQSESLIVNNNFQELTESEFINAIPTKERVEKPSFSRVREESPISVADIYKSENRIEPDYTHLLINESAKSNSSVDEFQKYSNGYRELSLSTVISGKNNINTNFFDVDAIRKDFPILSEKVNGKNLIWFDNAATTQKPKSVIDRITYFYEHENSNVHRAAHALAAKTTDAYEKARQTIADFINAPSLNEIVFVRGTTEGINLIAQTFGKANIGEGDEIIVSNLEHHANIVPWQMLCAATGAKLRVIPVNENGEIILSEYQKLLNSKTKLVSVTQVSNVLGTITPINEIVEAAHRYGAKVVVDGAQGASHIKVDVQALDCDFYVFSGHKIYGPTGIGVVYAKAEILKSIPPYQGGGNMIADVTFEKTIFQEAPYKFEAGTGNIADAVGLGAAIEYVANIGIEKIFNYEHYLLEYGIEALRRIPGVKLIGNAKQKTSVLSFVLDGISNDDIGKEFNKEGIAIRTGHHCAQPILRRFGLESAARPSIAFYNTTSEIDVMVEVLKEIKNGKFIR